MRDRAVLSLDIFNIAGFLKIRDPGNNFVAKKTQLPIHRTEKIHSSGSGCAGAALCRTIKVQNEGHMAWGLEKLGLGRGGKEYN